MLHSIISQNGWFQIYLRLPTSKHWLLNVNKRTRYLHMSRFGTGKSIIYLLQLAMNVLTSRFLFFFVLNTQSRGQSSRMIMLILFYLSIIVSSSMGLGNCGNRRRVEGRVMSGQTQGLVGCRVGGWDEGNLRDLIVIALLFWVPESKL